MATKKRVNAKEEAINKEIERRRKKGLYKEEERILKTFKSEDDYLFYCIVTNILSEQLYKYIISTEACEKPTYMKQDEFKNKIKMAVVDIFLIEKIAENEILKDKIIRLIELEGIKEIKKMDYNEELTELYQELWEI